MCFASKASTSPQAAIYCERIKQIPQRGKWLPGFGPNTPRRFDGARMSLQWRLVRVYPLMGVFRHLNGKSIFFLTIRIIHFRRDLLMYRLKQQHWCAPVILLPGFVFYASHARIPHLRNITVVYLVLATYHIAGNVVIC